MSWSSSVARTGKRVALVAAAALTVTVIPVLVQPASAEVFLDRNASIEACSGIKPTPGSENTLKDVVGGDLQPGGSVSFEVTYPNAGFETGDTFVLSDCFGVVDAKGDMVQVLDKFQVTFVPNGDDFSFDYDLTIPDTVPVGTQVCNWIKTTEGPSDPQSSNRKGDICFNVGGTLRVEKVDAESGDPVYGAKFEVACEDDLTSLPTATIGGLQDADGNAVTGNPVTGWLNEVDGIVNAIAISGEEGAECTVTELAAPSGYVLPPVPADRVHTFEIPRVGTSGQTVAIENEPVPPDYDDIVVETVPAGSYDLPTTWALSKTVDDAAHSGVAGQTAGSSTWTVGATKTVGAPTNFVLTGQTATLKNSNPVPVSATVGVTVGGAAGTVDCDPVMAGAQTTAVIPAAGGGVDGQTPCTYTGSPTGTGAQVVVTATSLTPFVGNGSATSAITWTVNDTGPQSLDLDDTRAGSTVPASTATSGEWSYPETFSCPTDGELYDNGGYERVETNTVSTTTAGVTSASADVTVTCVVPDGLEVTTSPSGTYEREASWQLTKTVDDDAHSGIAGRDAGTSQWTVTATKTVGAPENYTVAGQTATITNTNAFAVSATVSVLVGGVAGTVDCDPGTAGDQSAVQVPAASSGTDGVAQCSYSGEAAGESSQVVVTVTPSTPLVDGDSTSTGVTWTPVDTGAQQVEVSDSRPGSPLPQTVGTTTSWSYDEVFACTSDTSEYTAGAFSYSVTNQASATGSLTATASVDVDCALPEALAVATSPEGEYDVLASWQLAKTVDPAAHSGIAGQEAGESTWSVTATRTDAAPSNLVVAGASLTVTNSNLFEVEADVSVTIGGTAATVDCAPGTAGNQATVVVPAATGGGDGSATCSYSGTADQLDDTAVVTVTPSTLLVDGDNATESIDWTAVATGPQSITVDDDRAPAGIFTGPVSSTTTWEYDEAFPCSGDRADYDEQGQLTDTVDNTATSDVDGAGPAKATVTVDCVLPDGLAVATAPAGTYEVPASWTLDKTVDDAEHAGTAGSDAGTSTWTVTATRTDGAPTGYALTGQQLTVGNSNAFAVPATVSVTVGGAAATVDCDPETGGAQADVVVPAAANGTPGSAVCSYDGAAGAADDDVVVVTVTPGNDLVDPATATEAVTWAAVATGPQAITVADDRAPAGTFADAVSATTTWEYDEEFACPAGAEAYDEDRQLEYAVDNTATSDVEGAGPETATVTVACTLPTNGLSVQKSVTSSDAVVNPGDTLTYTLTVTATGERGETAVVVSDYVPGQDPDAPESGETTYVDGSADCDDLGPCTVEVDEATGLITWALGNLDSGDERTVTFAVTVDASPDSTAISDVLNAAVVESDETPTTPSNQTRTPVTVVLPNPPLVDPEPEPTPPAPVTPRVLPFTGASSLELFAYGTGAALLGALLVGLGRARRAAG